MDNMNKPLQKILFGSPGTGKSYKIDKVIIPNSLEINNDEKHENVIKTVFHPEYTYGDFVGKLMPITRSGKVEYHFYEGDFLKALGQAYKNIIKVNGDVDKAQHVALVIDEINRGNSSAIFGSVFQLLDRDNDGWSSYAINVNEITFTKIVEITLGAISVEFDSKHNNFHISYAGRSEDKTRNDLKQELTGTKIDLTNRIIAIPPNLSILATMNTSDSSIYYMDSAFKRRWEWEFIDINSESICKEGIAFENESNWNDFRVNLNKFIKSNHKHIRGIEDKQVGKYFIKDFINDKPISYATIQNKLMFFLWDSVFNRDKKPLIQLLYGKNSKEHEDLITFGDFAEKVKEFIAQINKQNV